MQTDLQIMTVYRSFIIVSLFLILTGIALANENLLPEDLYPSSQIVDVGGVNTR